jgi:hypothetical protein
MVYQWRTGNGPVFHGYWLGSGLVDRNTDVDYDGISSRGFILSDTVNDIALTALDDAPIDPRTGLKAVTAAVATNGDATYSTSLIKNIGLPEEVVYDIASDSTGTAVSVSFDGQELTVVRSDGTVYVWHDVSQINADGVAPDLTYSASSDPALLGTVSKVVSL